MAAMREVRFRAMGSECHLVVMGGDADALRRAQARVDELEARWSRFLPDSEVSLLNADAGAPVEVSADTVMLVERAVEETQEVILHVQDQTGCLTPGVAAEETDMPTARHRAKADRVS